MHASSSSTYGFICINLVLLLVLSFPSFLPLSILFLWFEPYQTLLPLSLSLSLIFLSKPILALPILFLFCFSNYLMVLIKPPPLYFFNSLFYLVGVFSFPLLIPSPLFFVPLLFKSTRKLLWKIVLNKTEKEFKESMF